MKPIYDRFMNIFETGSLGLKRGELIPLAYGRVLEIGTGTGVNLKYYDLDQVAHIVLSDKEFSPVLHHQAIGSKMNYKIQEMDVTHIPYEDKYFDTIVVTLVFCTVRDVQMGLKEIRRVLKDEGHIIFIEHVLPENQPLKGIFNSATPLWKRMASGCHLNRDFLKSLELARFAIEKSSKFNKSAFVAGRAYKKK